jgi:hypothetical protein
LDQHHIRGKGTIISSERRRHGTKLKDRWSDIATGEYDPETDAQEGWIDGPNGDKLNPDEMPF